MNHRVFNQAPALTDHNPYRSDPALQRGVEREGAAWADTTLSDFGARVGSAEVIRWGIEANESPPVLRTHDRYGNRSDTVDFHPSYHHLMALSVEYGLHA